MAISKTSFNSENQPVGRKPRGKSERNKILDSFKRMSRTEEEFYDLLTTKAFNPEDNFSFKELLSRLSPIPKSTNPLVKFDCPEDADPHVKASHAIAAVARGEVPPDVGHLFITSISLMLNIQEKTDFEERLKAIEDASEQD